jgi:hypothetical protein
MNEDIFKSISALEAALIIGVINAITELVKKVWRLIKEKRERRKYSIDNTSLIHEKVKNALKDIMLAFRPWRMFVFHYWNGDKTYADLSLVKTAIRHEVAQYPELPFITEHYQGRPTPEMFYHLIKETFKKGHCQIENLAQIKDNPPLLEFFETWNIQSMLFIRINDKDEQPAAIMVMQWPGPLPVRDKEIREIKLLKRKIEDIYAGRPIRDDWYYKQAG